MITINATVANLKGYAMELLCSVHSKLEPLENTTSGGGADVDGGPLDNVGACMDAAGDAYEGQVSEVTHAHVRGVGCVACHVMKGE